MKRPYWWPVGTMTNQSCLSAWRLAEYRRAIAMPSSRGNVKARQVSVPFSCTSSQIVYRILRFENCLGYPSHSRLCNSSALQSTSRSEATTDRGQNRRLKKRQVFEIVRTIQKHRSRGIEAQCTGAEMFPSSFRGHLVILSGWISTAGLRLSCCQGELGTPYPASVFFSSQSRPVLPVRFHVPRRKSYQSRRIRVRPVAFERVPSSLETKGVWHRQPGLGLCASRYRPMYALERPAILDPAALRYDSWANHYEKALGIIQSALDLFSPPLARPDALEVRPGRKPLFVPTIQTAFRPTALHLLSTR